MKDRLLLMLIFFLFFALVGYLYLMNRQERSFREEFDVTEEEKVVEEESRDVDEEMGEGEAFRVAQAVDECLEVGQFNEEKFYNDYTKTWWFGLSSEKKGCNPACVVFSDGSVEVNWRCTGLIVE
jgi:hypothetical protein